MAEKRILAALELTDHEVRLLVGEYYNTRVNVLWAKAVPCTGMEGFSIKSPTVVAQTIKSACQEASTALGMEIKRVLLAIPSYRVMKNTVRVSQGIENYDRKVTLADLQALVRKGYSYPVASDKALISWMPLKYYTNRIAFKRMPVGEPCDALEAEIDLFSADKMTAFDYARVIEQAGLEVIDICLDIFAAAKEASLFELSMNKTIVLADIEHDRTTLAILHNGQMAAVKMLENGFGDWENALMKAYPISRNTAHKLILQNADLSDHLPDDTPVHLWKRGGKMYQITVHGLNEALKPAAQQWCQMVEKSAGNLFQLKNMSIIITGEGAEMDGLADYIRLNLHVPATTYYPDTIGVRQATWTVSLGLIYAFIDCLPLYHNKKMSVDTGKEPVSENKEDEDDDPMTRRLKDFFQGK